MTRPSHPCAACGGTGKTLGVIERQYGDSMDDLRRVIVGSGPCPVCLGAGTFPDPAETYRLAVEAATRPDGHPSVIYAYARLAARAAFRAVPGLKGEKS